MTPYPPSIANVSAAADRKKGFVSEASRMPIPSMSQRYWSDLQLSITVDGPQGERTVLVEKPYARLACHPAADVHLPGHEARRPRALLARLRRRRLLHDLSARQRSRGRPGAAGCRRKRSSFSDRIRSPRSGSGAAFRAGSARLGARCARLRALAQPGAQRMFHGHRGRPPPADPDPDPRRTTPPQPFAHPLRRPLDEPLVLYWEGRNAVGRRFVGPRRHAMRRQARQCVALGQGRSLSIGEVALTYVERSASFPLDETTAQSDQPASPVEDAPADPPAADPRPPP